MEPANKLDKTYTYGDLLKFPEEDRWELIDGSPYLQARPTTVHQEILAELVTQIRIFLRNKPCRIFSEISVWLEGQAEDESAKGYVIPDIAIVCDPNKIVPAGVIGAPDMIIEIVSPSNAFMDRNKKLESYRKAGVNEYWIVEPELKFISVHRLKDDAYWVKTYDEGLIPVETLPSLTIDFDLVFPKQTESTNN